jgi:hypothetical protein
LHTAPFDNSQFHKIWISDICFVLGKFGSLYVILLNTCWRAMGRHGTVKMTVAHGGTARVNGPCAAHSTVKHGTASTAARHSPSQCRAGTAVPRVGPARHGGHLYQLPLVMGIPPVPIKRYKLPKMSNG